MQHLRHLLLFATGLFLLDACDDTKDETKPSESAPESVKDASSQLEPGQEFALGQVVKKTQELEDQLAANAEIRVSSCAALDGYKKSLRDLEHPEVMAAVEKATRLCDHDVPLAVANVAVRAAEEARTTKPDKKTLSECFNAHLKQSFETLSEKFPEDEEYGSLVERFEAVCPKKS